MGTTPSRDRRDAEFSFVEAGARTYLVRCRQETPSGVRRHGGFARWKRTWRAELRWLVDVESDRDLLPILRESFADQAGARARVEQLERGLRDGIVEPSRWPAVVRHAPWWRRHMSR